MLRVQVWPGEATEVKVGCSPWFRQREVQQAGRGLRDDSAAVSSDELHEGNEGQGESRVDGAAAVAPWGRCGREDVLLSPMDHSLHCLLYLLLS